MSRSSKVSNGKNHNNVLSTPALTLKKFLPALRLRKDTYDCFLFHATRDTCSHDRPLHVKGPGHQSIK